ncbi:ferritin, heavy subunit [Hydra vulgaris]|uniref:ferritin, heavy subunit n=1 Tax=Hydra vulgaris TaxID=6087 RepID=UPI001F5E56F9|nr:ferritin, heavy subunit-like [Hydra vulgaris]
MVTQCRQNFHDESEEAINNQINMELYASYMYLSMAYHFDQDDVALDGYFKFFKHQSDEVREHAQKLMKYQNKRGGRVVYKDVQAPQFQVSTPVSALEAALELEKKVNESLLNVHAIAGKHSDPQAYHFDQDDVALAGYFKFFKHQSDEEREHAQKLMKYQNKRGGRVVYKDVQAPQFQVSTPVSALEAALELEKKVNESLLNVHAIAGKHSDPHLCDFLESEFLDEQVESINEIAKLITNAKRCGDGLGVYQFDKLSLSS